MTNKLCISIVSHGHGIMVQKLIAQLLKFDLISEIILTLNIPEDFPVILDRRFKIIKNFEPSGFGQNHNNAFLTTRCDYFCVLNPDIVFINNPFPVLISSLNEESVGLVAPVVLINSGSIQDNTRRFLTPWRLIKRVAGVDTNSYLFEQNESNFMPDWVAGMFMLFKSEVFAKLGGFDVRYFMYCEDADICTRLWKSNYLVVACLSTSVEHSAQRASYKSLKHFSWHACSMLRYFLSHSFSLPRK